MKKHLTLFALAAMTMGLAACGGNSEPYSDSDQDIANNIAEKSGLIVSSATNRGLEIGENGVNRLKSPAYLYVFHQFSTRATIKNEKTVVTGTIEWSLSNADLFTAKDMKSTSNPGMWKYTPKYSTEEQTVVFTGTVSYGEAKATATFNVTLEAKA